MTGSGEAVIYMENNHEKNKRIAKNTLLLYFRMFLLMAISLYTSRVVLQTLGIEDYGIYNVVGGIVAMFSLLSGSLSAAITRFINYEMGLGNPQKLNHIFCSAVTIQGLLGLLILIGAETIGIWFLNVKMNIPETRMYAANWVFQYSILTFIINLISIPYNATIIAHERMSAFAYISIVEAIFKLVIAYLITISPIDKLIFYALLMCLVSLAIRIIYGNYCKKHFAECHYHFIWNKQLLKNMFSFAGWNFIGASSAILRDQGGNIVINLFCGPTVNAARGIAVQVNNAIGGFVNNFMTAINPQITQSYSAGKHDYMMLLIQRGARFSFFLLLLLSLPILINCDYILSLWLGNYPPHTTNFVQLVLVFTIIESLSNPLVTAMLATGKIKNYQIVVGGLQMMNLPISYILLRLGGIPETVLFVAISLSVCCLSARLYMLRNLIGLNARYFLKEVVFKVTIVACMASIPLLFIKHLWLTEISFINFVTLSCISILTAVTSILYIGCKKAERDFIRTKTSSLIEKIRK